MVGDFFAIAKKEHHVLIIKIRIPTQTAGRVASYPTGPPYPPNRSDLGLTQLDGMALGKLRTDKPSLSGNG